MNQGIWKYIISQIRSIEDLVGDTYKEYRKNTIQQLFHDIKTSGINIRLVAQEHQVLYSYDSEEMKKVEFSMIVFNLS